MKKILAMALLAMGILAAVPASADCAGSESGYAEVCVDEGDTNVLTVDGNAGNEDPLDGYVRVDHDGNVCASDEGSPNDDVEDSELCLADAGA